MSIFSDILEQVLDPGAGTGDPRPTPSPPPPEASAEEKAYYEAMTEILTRPKTEHELLMEDYSEQVMQGLIENLPLDQESKEMAMELARRQMAELDSPEAEMRKKLNMELMSMQLEGIEEARALGEVTGDLTEQEMTALNTMEANAIQTLTETVGREQEKIMGSVVSQMVDRGVLQGTVGAQAMAQVGERTQELIAQGTRAITSQKMGAILEMGEAQKARQLQTKALLQSGVLTGQGLGQQWTGQAMGYIGGQSALAQQMQQTGQQFGAGLAAQREQMQAGLGAQMWGTMFAGRQSAADRALQAQIAMTQAEAQKYGARWGAYGQASPF